MTYKTEVAPLITEYQSKYAGKAVSDEGTAFLDRVIDTVTQTHEALSAQYFVS